MSSQIGRAAVSLLSIASLFGFSTASVSAQNIVHEVVISGKSTSGNTDYSLEATGSIEKVSGNLNGHSVSIGNGDQVSGNRVDGKIWNGKDGYRVFGNISKIKFANPKHAQIYIDSKMISGSHSSQINSIKQDCVSFNPSTTQVRQINGNWKIVDGQHWMFDFGNHSSEARNALQVIKNYQMNQSCFVGRPDSSFQYLLTNDRAPSGSLPKEDCIKFNPATAEVRQINGNWKIVDGQHWMFDFGNKKSEATKLLKIIQKYDFNHSCFVGRPDPSFSYLRKSGNSANNSSSSEVMPFDLEQILD